MTNKEIEENFGVKLKATTNPKNQFEVCTEIDENDGDYLENTAMLDLEEFGILVPVLKAIQSGELNSVGDCKRDNYVMPDECEDLFMEIDPSNEYGGHDLEITSLTYYDKDGNPFEVKL